MHFFRKILLVSALAFAASACGTNETTSALSDESSRLHSLFRQHYVDQYAAGRCADNVKRFVRALSSIGEDARNFQAAVIENKGFSVFGMVNAQKARDSRFNRPSTEERNWYYHAVLIDKRDQTVYDFDFTIDPTPISLSSYIEEMFLDEPEWMVGSLNCFFHVFPQLTPPMPAFHSDNFSIFLCSDAAFGGTSILTETLWPFPDAPIQR